MRNRRAIVFFLAWSLLFAFAIAVNWIYRHPPAAIQRTTLSALSADGVTRVEIVRTDSNGKAERVAFARIDGRWRLDLPISAEADEPSVKSIIDTVVFAEPKDSLAAQDMEKLHRSANDFGLESPGIVITLVAGARREEFAFGKTTAGGDEVYVRQDGGGAVMTVPTQVVQKLKLPLGDFRRRNLFSFASDDVTGVGLKDADGPFSRMSIVNGTWRLAEPIEAPADRKAAEALLAAVCSARVISYAALGEGLGIGLGEKNEGYVLMVRNSVGTIEKAVIGAACSTNEVWALTPEGAVVKVAASLLDECRRCQKILADRRIFPVDAGSVVSFSVSEGFPAYMVSRDGASSPWKLVSPTEAPADVAVVEKMLARLLELNADAVLKETAASNVLNVSVATQTTNFPACSVSRTFIPEGMRFQDLREKLLIRQPVAKVRKVQVSTAAGVKWEVKCPNALSQGEKPHELFARLEEGIMAESVESVTLSKDDLRRYGLDRPSYTISFELDDSDSALKALQLGAAAPGGGRYANMGGAGAVFVLSASTVSILTKPVE